MRYCQNYAYVSNVVISGNGIIKGERYQHQGTAERQAQQ